MNWEIEKIIEVANCLLATGSSAASTGEQIAAAFVLDKMEYLPNGYSVIEAWDRLDNWQQHVYTIRREYLHLIEGL